MRAKDVEFDVTYVDLWDKPDWFLEISPRGKVPVLKVDDDILFESNAICEYLDEMVAPQLHPADPIKRARNRAWTDYVHDFSGALGKIGYAKSAADVDAALPTARKALELIEEALEKERETGPFFNGPEICLVDAAYAPLLQRFRMNDAVANTGLLDGFPLVSAWTDALLASDLVSKAVPDEFPQAWEDNHKRRESYVWYLMQENRAAAE
jgi:glutathione S-transferase